MLTRSASKKTNQGLDKEEKNVTVSQKDILKTRPPKENSKAELHLEENEKQQIMTSLVKNKKNSCKKGQNSTSKSRSVKKDKHSSESSESNLELSNSKCTASHNGRSYKSNSVKKAKTPNAKKKLFSSENCINEDKLTVSNDSEDENVLNQDDCLQDCNLKSDNLKVKEKFSSCQEAIESSLCEQSSVETMYQNDVENRIWNSFVLKSRQNAGNDASCKRNILDDEIMEVTESNSSIPEQNNGDEKLDRRKSLTPVQETLQENSLDPIESKENNSKNERLKEKNSNVESECGSNKKIMIKTTLEEEFRNEKSIEIFNVNNNNEISEFNEGGKIRLHSSQSEKDSGNEMGKKGNDFTENYSDLEKSNSANDSEENGDYASQSENKNHSRVSNLDGNASKEYMVDKSISEMADKLNFSEILKKFKVKQSDRKIIIADGDETQMNGDEEIKMDSIPSEEGLEKISSGTGGDEDEEKKSETMEFNSDKENSSKDERNSFESTIPVVAKETEMESDEILQERKILKGELHQTSKILPRFDEESQISNGEVENKISDEDLIDEKSNSPSKTVKFNSNDVKNELNTAKVKKIKLNDSNSFDVEKSKKRNRDREMGPEFKKKKMKTNNQKIKKEKPSNKSMPPPTRNKKPNGKSKNRKPKTVEKSKKKYFDEDGYIPLDVSGSTKFALGKLDHVKPYQKHEAISLKEKLLFGGRIKRFASSKCLEVLKLKRKAASKIF